MTEEELLKAVPELEEWEEREGYLTYLCTRLNMMARQVYTGRPAEEAPNAAVRKARKNAAPAAEELTPAELRGRVSGLEQVVKLMASTFLEHQIEQQDAVSLDSRLQGLKATARRFELLMKCATSPRDAPLQQLKDHNLLQKPPLTLLTLPYEVRERIFDRVALTMYPNATGSDRASISTEFDGHMDPDQSLLVFPLAQVSRQVRSEFLPRWHRIIELSFDWDPIYRNHADRWLELFGPSRIPMARSFRFQFGDDFVRVELRGAPPEPKSEYDTDDEAPEPSSVVQREILKVSTPPTWEPKARRARERRENNFEEGLQNYVVGLVVISTLR